MSELDAILKELAAQNNNDEPAQITQSTQPLVNVVDSQPSDASPDHVSTPKVPLHLSYSINAADVREILNVNSPLPYDVGISRVYGCAFHSPPSASGNGPTVYPPPHPFLEVQRRRAFEKLKSNFLSLLDQHLSTAKLKGKSNASSSGSGKAAFERWHFAVKLSESIQASESSYYRNRRRDSPVSSSHATWVSLKDNVTSRVEAEVRALQTNALHDGSRDGNQREPPPGIEFGVEPILMCRMERSKKKYKFPAPGPSSTPSLSRMSNPKIVDTDFAQELTKLGLPDPTNLILDLRRSSDSTYASFLDSLTKGLQRPSSLNMKGGRVLARAEDAKDGRGKVVTLSAFGVSMRINGTHYEKAKAMHEAMGGDESEMHGRLFSLLCRYDALEGAGFQAAIGSDVFDSLLNNFDVRMECFASPLNSRYGVFCSAFPDIDCWFGSLGSFFDFRPTRGSYEANPPFVPDFISRMGEHMEDLLTSTDEALSFVVIVPAWKDTEGWKRLKAGKFLTRHEVVAQSAHQYREGSSYRRKGNYRVASFDTSVFWWQNEAGRIKYEVKDGKVADLKRAFRGTGNAEGTTQVGKRKKTEEVKEKKKKKKKKKGQRTTTSVTNFAKLKDQLS